MSRWKARCSGRIVLRGAREWLAKKASVLSWSLVLVWLAFFCDYVLMTMAIPIFPLLGVDGLLVGALFSAKAAAQILAAPLVVNFVDGHERAMIVAGLALQTCCVLIFAATFDYRIWMFARAVSGVASTAIVSSGFAHLSRVHSDRNKLALVMGLATTGIVSGVCLGPIMGGGLYEVSPSLPFLLLASLEVLVGVLAWARLPVLIGQGGNEKDTTSVGEILRLPLVARALGALVVANAAISSLESTIARFAGEAFGLSAGRVGALFLFVSVPSVVMSGFAGPVGNRIGRTNLVRAGLMAQGIFTMLGPKRSLIVEVVSLLGLGLGMGAIDGAAPALLAELCKGSGKIFVLSNAAVQLGFVIGPVLGNAVVARSSFGAWCLLAGAFLVAYAPMVRDGRHRAA